jgi:hypothetical protein
VLLGLGRERGAGVYARLVGAFLDRPGQPRALRARLVVTRLLQACQDSLLFH